VFSSSPLASKNYKNSFKKLNLTIKALKNKNEQLIKHKIRANEMECSINKNN